ncbi:MAG: hypothetical protein PVG99_13300 [Desulfobacteraceae bacterium]
MGIIEKLVGKKKGPVYKVAWNLSDLKRKIPRLPKLYPAGGFTFGAGKGVAEEQIPIICRNIEEALTALETGLDPNGNPITRKQIGEGLRNLVNATKKPGFAGLLNAVLSIDGVAKLESYMDRLGDVADQLCQMDN